MVKTHEIRCHQGRSLGDHVKKIVYV